MWPTPFVVVQNRQRTSRIVQAIHFSGHPFVRFRRQHQAGVAVEMVHLALDSRPAKQGPPLRKKPRKLVLKPASQRAIDEQVVVESLAHVVPRIVSTQPMLRCCRTLSADLKSTRLNSSH